MLKQRGFEIAATVLFALALMLFAQAGASAAGAGQTCGGFGNIQCDGGLFCEYPTGRCGVLDRPGKGRQSATATVSLRAGLVPVRLEYFNGYDRPQLKVEWSGLGVPLRPSGHPLGVLLISSYDDSTQFSDDDARLLSA